MIYKVCPTKRYFFFLLIFSFLIPYCDKKTSSAGAKTTITEEELMQKYGPKD